jgi:hypothetical protein
MATSPSSRSDADKRVQALDQRIQTLSDRIASGAYLHQKLMLEQRVDRLAEMLDLEREVRREFVKRLDELEAKLAEERA